MRIEDDRAYGIKLAFQEGMRFDNGLLSPGLASDRRLGESVFERPYVLDRQTSASRRFASSCRC